jgi:hypothetical protein
LVLTSGSPNSLTILGSQTTLACLGTEAIINLTAREGVPPYRWDLLESDPAFALLGASTEQATVTGSPAKSGTYHLRIQLTDALKKPYVHPFDVSVIDVPVIDQASVPNRMSRRALLR